MTLWDDVAAERRAIADLLDTLTPEQWETPSLCGAWTVRDLAAHLVMPHTATLPRFALAMLTARGSFERANVAMTATQAARPTAELVADLRRFAEGRFCPPGMPAVSQLAEILVHGQDLRIPLGVDDTRAPQSWADALDFLMTPKARRGFVGRGLPALRWIAVDVDWHHDPVEAAADLPDVRGPASALGLSIMGRRPGLARLTGAGVVPLTAWLDARG